MTLKAYRALTYNKTDRDVFVRLGKARRGTLNFTRGFSANFLADFQKYSKGFPKGCNAAYGTER